MTAESPALLLEGIFKSYSAPVLEDISFELRQGEVHALVGANGAGKSTLAKIVCGLVKPDSGEMSFLGETYSPGNKADAEHAGVHIVQQELNLIPTMTVAENLFLNRLPRRLGFVKRNVLYDLAATALDAVGLHSLDPDTLTGKLGVGQQQLVEIASALSRNLKILILDEPTAMLTTPEIDMLFQRISELRSLGIALIYISHRMEEIRRIADRVSTLRDGRVVDTCPASEATLENMVSLMTGAPAGSKPENTGTSASRTFGPVALRVRDLCGGPLTRNISFEVRKGEILGITGLVGSGRTETLRALYGADPVRFGSIEAGNPLARINIRSPRDAVRAGIGMVPEDRKGQGLLLTQPIRSNVSLANINTVSAAGWLSRSRERNTAEQYRTRLAIRSSGVEQSASGLSGGNQQKVLISRWLLRDCDVLLFDEPTRGIDVQSRTAIYALLEELAAAGKAIVMASSDLLELFQVCDRIIVMSAGEIAATYARGEWTEEKIMSAAFSRYASQVRPPAGSNTTSESSISTETTQ